MIKHTQYAIYVDPILATYEMKAPVQYTLQLCMFCVMNCNGRRFGYYNILLERIYVDVKHLVCCTK